MSSTVLTYTISDAQRIDTRLASQLPYSRSFFHHLFERKGITISRTETDSGRPIKKSYKLKQGDVVHIESIERFLDGGVLEEAPALTLKIRREDDDYIVIYKEKGVLSHPNSVWDVAQPNVVGALYHHFKASGTLPSSASFIRAGLIHRLDKETDGVMIVAKTELGLTHFKSLFQQKSEATSREEKEAVPLKKYYQAVCYATEHGDTFLGDKKAPFYIESLVTPKTPHALPKMGISKVLSREEGEFQGRKTYILQIEILTGRTHQIRVHMSENGLPIVGDYLYGTDEEGVAMNLTAVKMEFMDSRGVMQCVSI